MWISDGFFHRLFSAKESVPANSLWLHLVHINVPDTEWHCFPLSIVSAKNFLFPVPALTNLSFQNHLCAQLHFFSGMHKNLPLYISFLQSLSFFHLYLWFLCKHNNFCIFHLHLQIFPYILLMKYYFSLNLSNVSDLYDAFHIKRLLLLKYKNVHPECLQAQPSHTQLLRSQ